MGGELVPCKKQQIPRKLFKVKKDRKPKAKPEWKLQAAVVSDFHKWQDAGWPFEFAGDMNAGKRNGARAKITGLTAGEPDIRLYFANARLKMIELKTEKGRLSEAQIDRHQKLEALGFEVVTVYAKTEDDAVDQCSNLLVGWFAEGTVRY